MRKNVIALHLEFRLKFSFPFKKKTENRKKRKQVPNFPIIIDESAPSDILQIRAKHRGDSQISNKFCDFAHF